MCAMAGQSLEKNEKVRKRKDYQEAYDKGVRYRSENFIVLVKVNPTGAKRLGITVSKKVGKKAVIRNRIKRLIREFFRLNKDRFPDSKDIVIIARNDISSFTYQDVCVEFEKLFEKT